MTLAVQVSNTGATIKKAAPRIGLTPHAFYLAIYAGRIPPGVWYRIGPRSLRVDLDKLDEWRANGGNVSERAATSPAAA